MRIRPGGPAPGARPTMTRWLLVVGGIVALVLAAFLALFAAIRDELPAQVASHWGTDGVDGVSSAGSVLWTLVVLVAGIFVLMGVLSAALAVEARRLLGMVTVGLTGLLAVGLGGSLVMQRGLVDPHAAGDVGGQFALGLVAGAALAALVFWLLPTRVPPATAHTEAAAKGSTTGADQAGGTASGDAADGLPEPEVVLPWSAAVPAGRGGYVVLGLLLLLGVGLATTPASVVATPVIVLVAVAVVAMLRSRLRIDESGVQVRGLGITWLKAPAETIGGAEAGQVRPLAEFGGYGLRYSLHGRGFVTLGGPALRLRIPNGADTWISLTATDLPAAVAAARRISRL